MPVTLGSLVPTFRRMVLLSSTEQATTTPIQDTVSLSLYIYIYFFFAHTKHTVRFLIRPAFLLGLFFNPGDEGGMFLRNTGRH